MINLVAYTGAGALFAALAALVAFQARRSRTGWMLAGACVASAAWLIGTVMPLPTPAAGTLELARSLAWYGFLLHIYRRAMSGRGPLSQGFLVMGVVAALAVAVWLLTEARGSQVTLHLFSSAMAVRIGLAVCNLLLIENLYRNTPEEERWHINLPCIGLAAMFLYDIALAADIVLFRHASDAMVAGRAVAAGLVVPLLAMGAARNREWDVRIHVSRTAVFHTASLIASGVLLVALAAVGELFRFFGAGWAELAEISLVFAGLVTIATVLTSGSLRSRLRRLLVDNFFTLRYDYRREWVRSIDLLSTADTYVPLSSRVIRAVAAVVDSPGGALLLHGESGFVWAGSWNMPATQTPLPRDHKLIQALAADIGAVKLRPEVAPDGLEEAWLAVGLRHGGQLVGICIVAPPRAPFTLDTEVFALLRVIGRQAAAYLAELQATERLLEAKAVHDYGKRFAFVAHDIKNVSSQLSMLLSNAELHLSNPAFQRDMLATVRASVQRISQLLRKLQSPEADTVALPIEPAERLAAVMQASPRLRVADITVAAEARGCAVGMRPAAFDAAVTHLLDNALDASSEAAAPTAVRVRIGREARHVVIDIIDAGPGMSAAFIRDRLFRPFETSKHGGSGIGAWQARELAREAGGDLIALSTVGVGTTMRLVLPASETLAPGRRAAE
jgi:putative PEP-CTERM system histidine kinase